MGFLFSPCQDPYGSCVRQYVVFGLSIIVFFLSAYSFYRAHRAENKMTVELLPLLVNCMTGLVLISLYLYEYYNTSVLLMVIEVYTYFLLTFIVIFAVLKRESKKNKKITYLTRTFLGVTVLTLVGVFTVLGLSFSNGFKCMKEWGIGGGIIILSELALMTVNFVYSRKYRKMMQ